MIVAGRDSLSRGTHAAREMSIRYAFVQYDGRSLYTQTLRTPINHAINHSRLTLRFGESSHDPWMSPRVLSPPREAPVPAHADAFYDELYDARAHHDFRRRRHEDDDESDVLLFARLSRRVDHR